MPSSENDEADHISKDMLIVWYQALLNRYNTVKESTNAIDNKTSIILAAAVAVLIFGVGDTAVILRPLGIVGAAGVAISIILSLININLNETPAEVNSSEDRPDYYHKHDEAFIWQLTADLERAIELLTTTNLRKAVLYRWLTGVFAVSSIILLTASYVAVEIHF